MLAAAQRLRRRGEFAATIRAGRRAGRGAVVVHLTASAVAPVGSSSESASGPEPASRTESGNRGSVGHEAAGAESTKHTEPARAGAQRSRTRAGFVVSKAVGGAVVRNTVKRRLRALMRERLADLPAGTDVVVRAQPSAAGRGYPRLGADLDAALAAALRPGRPRERRGAAGHD